MMRHPVLWAAILLAAAPAAAVTAAERQPSWRDYAGVENTSFVEPSGDRALQLAETIPASARDVFAAFTTSDGFKSWAVNMAQIELRVGGMIEASYDKAA